MDFYCPELRLCIEVDGSIHDTPETREKDEERTEFLNHNRINVIRFRNDEIENDVKNVLQRIKDYINEEYRQ